MLGDKGTALGTSGKFLLNYFVVYFMSAGVAERSGTGMVICLERGADLHMAQRIPLPLTFSCFSKIQIGFTVHVLAHPGSPGQRAVKRVCVCVVAVDSSHMTASSSAS